MPSERKKLRPAERQSIAERNSEPPRKIKQIIGEEPNEIRDTVQNYKRMVFSQWSDKAANSGNNLKREKPSGNVSGCKAKSHREKET